MRDNMIVTYEEGKKYLKEITKDVISEEQLKEYFNIEKSYKNKEDIFIRILKSIENTPRVYNVINFGKEDREDIFKNILCDYNVELILKKYNEETLYEEFCNNFEVSNVDNKNNLWRRFTKSVITACEFLKEFENAEEFDKYVDSFRGKEIELPQIISKRIFGLGFALSCDFLKELGYSSYAKPDIHIKDIFVLLNLCENNDDYVVFNAVIEMARKVNDTPYNIDKMLWLICAGDLYNQNIKLGNHKNEFIERVQTIIKK